MTKSPEKKKEFMLIVCIVEQQAERAEMNGIRNLAWGIDHWVLCKNTKQVQNRYGYQYTILL